MAHADRITPATRALDYAMAAFLAACFVLPSDAAYSLVFYIAVLPILAWRVTTAGPPHDAAFWAGAALIAWSALTLLWGRDDGGRAGAFAFAAAATLAFWCAAVMCLGNPRNREFLATMLVVLGCGSALFGLARSAFFPLHLLPGDLIPRLHGWGITFPPIFGAALLSVCALTALDAALRRPEHRGHYLAAAAIMAIAILCTRSRTPAAAFCIAALLRLAFYRRRHILLLATAILLPAACAWSVGLIRPGASGHIEVWRAAWAQIAEHPWFGNGLTANLIGLGADQSFPHDLYLSLLFYSGLPALGLFALWIALLTRGPHSPWALSLLANAMLDGLTDFGQITKGPGPLWLILWLPAALMVGQRRDGRKKAVLF